MNNIKYESSFHIPVTPSITSSFPSNLWRIPCHVLNYYSYYDKTYFAEFKNSKDHILLFCFFI